MYLGYLICVAPSVCVLFFFNMPYSIVHFFDDNTVETVPGHWVDKKHGTCAWPKKYKTASRLIEKKCMPNEIEFTYLKSRELYKGIGKYNLISY